METDSRYGIIWSEEENLLAMALYLLIDRPVGQKRAYTGHPWLVGVHRAIGRSVDSVYMKICNIAEVNPANTGSALSHTGSRVRELWARYEGHWETFWDRALPLLVRCGVQPDVEPVATERPHAVGGEVSAVRAVRLGQALFRRLVLTHYGERCCITGVAIWELLVASHIVPWSEGEVSRLDPANGLCLNALHDRAFDRGLLTLDADYRVVLSDQLLQPPVGHAEYDLFRSYQGKRIALPTYGVPKQEYLEWHRNNVFQG